MDDPTHRIRGVVIDILAAPTPNLHFTALQQYLHPHASLTTPLFSINSSNSSRDDCIIPTMQGFRDIFPDCYTDIIVVGHDHTKEHVLIKMELGMRPYGISDETLKGARLRVPLWVGLHLKSPANERVWTIDRLEFVVPTMELLRANYLGRLADVASYLSWGITRLVVANSQRTFQLGHVSRTMKDTSSFLLWRVYVPTARIIFWRPSWFFYMAIVYLYGVAIRFLWHLFETMQEGAKVLNNWRFPQIVVREVSCDRPHREVVEVREVKDRSPREHIVHLRDIKRDDPRLVEPREVKEKTPRQVRVLVKKLENE
ncbi:hypothetical protein BDV96DRAFT_652074 [Lophiotrema nucula]|uniref:SigF-like NTF2-like domain-containing protein n=1 Tax=Lophiotrema nucula TaxID=690887 RepID=A0A6A5YQE1_9PLEO|nr:hypothetical protein BDV96DRAFT_652074 [Lophiotrema nucula]